MLYKIPDLVIFGLKSAGRALLSKTKTGEFCVYVEGTGLYDILRIPGVDYPKTTTNHIQEIKTVLGIEAARSVIISQANYTISIYGISVDYRHISLLSDTMTFTGKVIGLNRYGITKMKNSPMMLASFEKTGEILYDAAFFGTVDQMKGVTEKIILGDNVELGTGKFDIRVEA